MLSYDREKHREATVRALTSRGVFIAAMGIVGILMYHFDIANAWEHRALVVVGTVFCIFGSFWMFRLAYLARHMD